MSLVFLNIRFARIYHPQRTFITWIQRIHFAADQNYSRGYWFLYWGQCWLYLKKKFADKFPRWFWVYLYYPKNLIVGCMCRRHPSLSTSIREFTNHHLDPILQTIRYDNKQCVSMGDFNVDLLKINSHTDSNDFYNNLTSHYFTPYILQPTRLHSNTLIDNIFFSSIEYQSLGDNLMIILLSSWSYNVL